MCLAHGQKAVPQGVTLIFSYIRRLGSFLGVLNFLNFNIFLGFSEL